MDEPDTTMQSPPDRRSTRKNTITLVHLFQIITACGLFFACMRYSPVSAIGLTILVTPAIIRTGLISQQFWERGLAFGLRRRFKAFATSILVTVITLAMFLVVFLLVSVAFGLLCVIIMLASMTATDLITDIGFIGTLGGTIWGVAAGLLSITWTQRLWRLPAATVGSF